MPEYVALRLQRETIERLKREKVIPEEHWDTLLNRLLDERGTTAKASKKG